MALIKNSNSVDGHRGALAGAWLAVQRRHDERRLKAALAGKPDRLLRDMGLDASAINAQRWAFELGGMQAIGNRP